MENKVVTTIENEVTKNLEIEITQDKKMFLNGKKTTLTELEKEIETSKSSTAPKALIRADKNLPYGHVIQVMGILQSAKINDISVAVK